MRAKKFRHIESGEKYNSLFPSADGKTTLIKKSASVNDTVKFIPKVVKDTLYQTKQLSQELLKEAESEKRKDVCKRIWEFVYKHIRYELDEKGVEQIRAPARTWADREKGVDCDCYTTFISSVLSNLKIPHVLRISKYWKDYFQHIYPVAFDEKGNEIVMDCVVDEFNYEEPYSEIKNTTMDLQYLSGVGEEFEDFSGAENYEMGELGKVSLMQKAGKVLNVVNKVNPATALLRNGFLITMRTNLFNVAQRLKWAYLSEADARKKGIDIPKWKKLVEIKNKLENLHFGAGGKKEDLKKAILTGNGNKNKEVSPLLGFEGEEIDINSPLAQLLGEEIYESEKDSLQGFGELGEPITAAAVGAATAGVAAIAALIKSIGNIFPSKTSGAADFQDSPADTQAALTVQNNTSPNTPSLPQAAAVTTPNVNSSSQSFPATSVSAAALPTTEDNASKTGQGGFWEQNKNWLKPTLVGIGSLGIITLLVAFFGKKKQADPAIAGIRQRHLIKSATYENKEKGKIKPIGLM